MTVRGTVRSAERLCPQAKESLRQKNPSRKTWIFLSKPQAWYIIECITRLRRDIHSYIISPCGAVSHHAPACIFLRLDDIQCFALVICNSYGIDDIHASRRDVAHEFKPIRKLLKTSFACLHATSFDRQVNIIPPQGGHKSPFSPHSFFVYFGEFAQKMGGGDLFIVHIDK